MDISCQSNFYVTRRKNEANSYVIQQLEGSCPA